MSRTALASISARLSAKLLRSTAHPPSLRFLPKLRERWRQLFTLAKWRAIITSRRAFVQNIISLSATLLCALIYFK